MNNSFPFRNIFILLFLFFSVPVFAETIRAVDGDTINYIPTGSKRGANIRLVGFDTPETKKQYVCKGCGWCPEQKELAIKAKNRLQELIDNPENKARLEQLPTFDNRGKRRLGVLFINDEDVADILIREKLAVKYDCPKNRCPKRIDWCGWIKRTSFKFEKPKDFCGFTCGKTF